MKRKSLLILNLVWAAVAIGAYLFGSYRQLEPTKPRPEETGVNRLLPKNSRTDSGPQPRTASQDSLTGQSSDPDSAQDFKPLEDEVVLLLETDVGAAIARIASINDDRFRAKMHGLVVQHYLQNDLDEALAYLVSTSEAGSGYRNGFYEAIDELAAQRGVEALKTWVEGIDTSSRPDSGEKLRKGGNQKFQEVVAQQAIRQIAKEDPDQARAWLVERADREWFRAYDLECVAKNIDFNPSNQLDWIIALPDMPKRRQEALGQMFSQYVSLNLPGAGEWLAGQELSEVHDEAIRTYAYTAAEWDQEAAQKWAEQISNEKVRTETLTWLKNQ